ncbi:putative toxin-antitoxin system toxin component, PIN family [Schaalia naturae]|uniref:Toxin-antitoxin system toxin component, PIN family n=1 Tax=Schaalia naturae TaxID=635203 RepID=A0ABW2SNV0_9ACTO
MVIDSNVWISALVFGGSPRRVLEQTLRDGDSIALSAEIVTEVRRTLISKFPGFLEDFDSLLAAMAPVLLPVRLGDLTVRICRDPDDDRVLETAILGAASYLITGDRDLRVLDGHRGIRIVTPAEWLEAPTGGEVRRQPPPSSS